MRYRLFWHVFLGLLCVVGGSAQCLADDCYPNKTNYPCDIDTDCCGEGCFKQNDAYGNTYGGGTGKACCLEETKYEWACCKGTVLQNDDQTCCDGQISYSTSCCNGKAVPENGGCCGSKVYNDSQDCCGSTIYNPNDKSCENGKVISK